MKRDVSFMVALMMLVVFGVIAYGILKIFNFSELSFMLGIPASAQITLKIFGQ